MNIKLLNIINLFQSIKLTFKLYNYLAILTILFLPLYYIKIISNNLIRLSLLDILATSTIIVWLTNRHIKISYQKIYHFLKTEKLFSLGLTFLGISLLISTIFSTNQLKSIGAIKSWFILPIIFSLINRLETNSIKKYLVIGISSITVALVSVIYFLSQNLTYDGRLKGFFEHPNYLAMFLGPSVFIFSFIKIKKIIRLIIISFISFIIFATQSYNVWLAIIVSFLLYLIIFKKIRFIHLLILSVICFTLLISQISTHKFNNIFTQDLSSLKERFIIYKVTAKIIKNNLITGIGLNNFQKSYLDYQKYFEPYPNWAVPMPHNFILAILVQMGIFGLIGFILIIGWAYKKIINRAQNQIAFTILTFIVTVGFLDTPYFKPDLAFIFWLVII